MPHSSIKTALLQLKKGVLMQLSNRDDLAKFLSNTADPQIEFGNDVYLALKRLGPQTVSWQPWHSICHIRNASRLVIGRQYRICRAGHLGIVSIIGKFLGETETGYLVFEFENNYTDTFYYDHLGLTHYSEEEGGDWDNWNWVEALNIWQTIL
jgi:hypothetical protein